MFICVLLRYKLISKELVLNILELLSSQGPFCAENKMVEICVCLSTWHKHRRTRSIVSVDTQAINQVSGFLCLVFFTHVVKLLSLGQERGQLG